MRVTKEKIICNSFLGFIFISCISEHSILGQLSLFLFLACGFLIYVKKSVHNSYFLFEILFILFSILQITMDIPIYKNVSIERTITLFICLCFDYITYVYLLNCNNFNVILKKIINTLLIALTLNTIFNIKWLVSGDRACAHGGISIFGQELFSVNAITLGWLGSIGLLLSILVYYNKQKRKLYFYTIMFSILMIISGTRKILICIIGAFLFYLFL